MFCRQCGVEMDDSDNFCQACGAPAGKTGKPSQETPLADDRIEAAMESTDRRVESGPAASRYGNRIILGLSVLLVIMLGVFLYNGGMSGSSGDSQLADAAKEKLAGTKNARININQIDNQNFPVLKLYFSVLDDKDESIDNLPLEYFAIRERLQQSTDFASQKVDSITQLEQDSSLCINLVMDTSGSMQENSKLDNAKKAATNFINIVQGADELEILEFNDYVRTKNEFTNDHAALVRSISQLYTHGQTALYDALYTALVQTCQKDGAKCVIVFTDGKNNKGSKSAQDVIDLARKTGIPIYTIGIGGDVESKVLTDIANQTGGYYVSTPTAADLQSIYESVFRIQKKQYVLTYTTTNTGQDSQWRNVELSLATGSILIKSSRDYTPEVVKPSLANFDLDYINNIIQTHSGSGDYSVVIKDLSNGELSQAGKFDQKMPASALINVPITLAVADMIQEGQLTLDTRIPFYYTVEGRGKLKKEDNGRLMTVDEMLQTMLSYSDNNCTNSFLAYIGIDEINRIVQSYGFTETVIKQQMYIGEGGNKNFTTCEEIGKMLELLYSDSLPIGSQYMNEHFKILDSVNRDGILKYLPSDAFILHHNGVTSEMYNETAFIGSGSKKYIITVLSCNGKYAELAETTALISRYVYEKMQE